MKKCEKKKRSVYNKDHNTKRYLNTGCILLVLSLLVLSSGCISEETEKPATQAEKLDKIVIASPSAPVATMAYIIENNMLDDIADDVELIVWSNPEQLRTLITREQIHITHIPSNVASVIYNKGTDLKLLRVIGWGHYYLISSNTSVQSLQDIKGQEIYVPFKGDMPDLVFRYTCLNQEIDPYKDIQIQYVSSLYDISSCLLTGNAKYAILREPVVSSTLIKAKKENMTFERVINMQEEWGKVTGYSRIPAVSLVALPCIHEQPEVTNAFCDAYDIAAEWVKQNPEDAALLAAKYVEGINPKVYEKSLKHTAFESISAEESRVELETMYSCFMSLDPASIGGKLPDDKFYYRNP